MSPDPQTARAVRPARWFHLPFRLLSSLVAVLYALQAVFAGQIMAGTFGSLLVHQNTAAFTDMVLVVTILAAVLQRWPGRGPLWPVAAVPALLGLSALQNYLGFSRLMTFHVPLGVLIIVLSFLLARRAWLLPGAAQATPSAEREVSGVA
jgi:hypothetical protein